VWQLCHPFGLLKSYTKDCCEFIKEDIVGSRIVRICKRYANQEEEGHFSIQQTDLCGQLIVKNPVEFKNTVATNAASGWTLTYSGATLTSGGNTITDAATIDEDSDGTPGTEQFGISASTNGDSTIATGYLRDSAADFDFVPNTTTTLASEAVATATETISISYLANISGATEPGSYSTTLTYIATGNF
jgi:predicted secreted protein